MQSKPMNMLGYAELIVDMESVRRKNKFVKVLLVFPAAFIAYAIQGGVGSLLQTWFQKADVVITVLQIALLLHFLGKGNLLKGFNKIVRIFDGEAWNNSRVLKYVGNSATNSWLPIFVNLMIFAGMMIGLKIGFSFLANVPMLQHFLENWNVLYPNAGSAPLFAFWNNSIIVPIALSFLAVFANWLFLDKLNEAI
jgi:hypothetical protein